MKNSLTFFMVCFLCLACTDAVDLTSLNKDLDNRNAAVSSQGIIVSPGPVEFYRWSRLQDTNMQVPGTHVNKGVVIKVNGNAYCYKVFHVSAPGPTIIEKRTYKLNKSTHQWQLYEIDLSQFFENFEYLFSYGPYAYGIAGDKRVGMININTGQFRWMAPFPGITSYLVTAVTIGSDGYILGGSFAGTDAPSRDQYWKYDIIRDRWTDLGGLPRGARSGSTAFVVGNKIYYGHGYQGTSKHDGNYRSDWLELNPSNNTYNVLANFPGAPRAWVHGFVLNDKIYLGWGGSRQEEFNDFWEYNPAENRWREKTKLGYIRYKQEFAIDNSGYIVDIENNEFWRYGDPTSINRLP